MTVVTVITEIVINNTPIILLQVIVRRETNIMAGQSLIQAVGAALRGKYCTDKNISTYHS